jgi:hypothetical protein
MVRTQRHHVAATEEIVINGLLFLAQHPELIDNALRAFALEYELTDHGARRRKIEADLKALEERERAIIDAQIAGIQAGTNPAIYAGLFAEQTEQRRKLQEERDALPSDVQPLVIPKQAGARVATVIGDLATARGRLT